MRKGWGQGEGRLAGLDDLLSQVAHELKRIYERYQIHSALDQVEKRLGSIVDQERRTLAGLRGARPDIEEREELLNRLPDKLSEAVERLVAYDFEDPAARSELKELLSLLEEIRRLEHYLRKEGSLFRGHTPLSFQEAQDLLERVEGLRRLEAQLSSSHVEEVDMELLHRLLGSDACRDMDGVARMEALLEEAGYIVRDGGRFELTPRGLRRIGQMALRDIYHKLAREGIGRHPIPRRGSQERATEESRPHVQGEPLHLNMIQTLRNALLREGRLPLRIHPGDFAVYESDHTTWAATVLLLDMSWSMSWEGRFAAAKKVALAMESLIRSHYPRDYFAIVGFFTRAVELKPRDLPEATWNMSDPFTNLQDGLHLAAELLERSPGRNQQMIVITDGQPTAYCRQGRLYCEWPLSFGGISRRAAEETLKEAGRVTRKGIKINTFMLDDSPVLKGFVDEMTRINRGRAFYTRPDRLGEYLLVDYVSRKRKKI